MSRLYTNYSSTVQSHQVWLNRNIVGGGMTLVIFFPRKMISIGFIVLEYNWMMYSLRSSSEYEVLTQEVVVVYKLTDGYRNAPRIKLVWWPVTRQTIKTYNVNVVQRLLPTFDIFRVKLGAIGKLSRPLCVALEIINKLNHAKTTWIFLFSAFVEFYCLEL